MGIGLAAGLAALGAGCNILGPVGYLVAGPPQQHALFELPDDRPAVVFLDDRQSVLPNRQIRQRIAKAAERTLLEGDAVAESEVIASDSVLAVSSRERFGRPMGIADVGQAVGAEVVIYATVDAFALSPNGVEYAPSAVLRVKVMDATKKERMWPPPDSDEEWHRMEVTPPARVSQAPKSASERTVAENQLADYVGRALGNVFLKHEVRDANPRIG